MVGIVSYGVSHLKIKAFDPAELGLSEYQNSEVVKIELRQRYFHISTVPCFGMGKFWVVRNSVDELHTVSEEVDRKLGNLKDKLRTPLRTYSLPIVIIILLMLAGAIKIGLFIHKKTLPPWSGQKLFENNIASVKKKLNAPAKSDYYIFKDSWLNPLVFKVDSLATDSFRLVTYDSINKKSRVPFYHGSDLIPYIENESKPFKSIWFSAKKLRPCINSSDYAHSTKFKGSKLEELDSLEKFRLTDIFRMGSPDIISTRFSENTWQNTYSIGIENNGMSFKIEKLISTGDFIDWYINDFSGGAERLPYKVSFTHLFYIDGKIIEKTEGHPVIYLSGKDSLNREVLFELKISKGKKEVSINKLK